MDVVAREGAVRCALCHEALGAGPTAACAGCATLLHADCARDLARCPTLGCSSPTSGAAPAPADDRPPVKRWLVFGALAPAVAFSFDAGMHLNPLAWGGFTTHPEPGEPFVVLGWPGVVLAAAAASVLGLAQLVAGRRGAVTRALLGAGVALATAHAVVFVPLLPLSLFGVLFLGFGLLGLTPFAALVTYLGALGHSLPARKGDASPRRRRRLGQGAAVLAGLALLVVRAALPPTAFLAAPAAKHLQAVELAALRSAVATLPARRETHEAYDPASLPEPLRSVARGGAVRGGPGGVVIDYTGKGDGDAEAFPYPYRLHLVAEDPTTRQEPCRRWVEVQPGCWSEYVLKTFPRRTVKRFGEE